MYLYKLIIKVTVNMQKLNRRNFVSKLNVDVQLTSVLVGILLFPSLEYEANCMCEK